MTLADLKRIVLDSDEGNKTYQEISPAMQRMKDECPPIFYRSNSSNGKSHDFQFKRLGRRCCFWHWISPPTRNGQPMPMLPYQIFLSRMLEERKLFVIRKARGIGMSTWLLYWLLFKSLREWKPGDMAILITGNALRLSQDLIGRHKKLTQRCFPEVYSELMEQSSTEATIAGVKTIGLPSRFAALRGYTGVRAIISDENDYWPISEQREMQSTIEPFYIKSNSNAWIILVSTPASGFGIMRQLETTPNSPYYSCVFDYTYGLEGSHPIYDKAQLDHIKNTSPDAWAREFLCQYTNLEGSVYDTSSIERALALGDKYTEYTNPANWLKDTHTVIALDPAWGSTSKYGIVIIQWIDQKAVVVHAKEYHFGNFSDMISEMFRLRNQCGNVSRYMVDSSAPEVINTLRREMQLDKISERGVKDIIASCRASNTPLERRLKVVPRFFNIEGRQMLQKSVAILSSPESYVAIPRTFSTLVQAIQGATAFEWKLDKTNGQPGLDVLDAFIMGLSYFRLGDQ